MSGKVRLHLEAMHRGPNRPLAHTDVQRICEMLFQTAAEGLVVVDGSGSIILVNPRMGELFGCESGQLLGSSIEELIPTKLRDHHRAQRTNYQKTPEKRPMGIGLDLTAQRKDGSVFPVEVSLNHFELEGERFVMGLVTDVSKRRKAEQELAHTHNELEKRVEERTAEVKRAEKDLRVSLEKERELNALKSRFVSMASHEFRTPLSTILSSVDLIGRYNDGPNSGKIQRHVAKVRSKVRELTVMLNDLLSLEKLEQGQVQCVPEEFDIVDLCIEVLEEMRDMAKPGQEFHFDHGGDQRLMRQDPRMLSNVLRNLLTNAIKYSPENSGIDLRTRMAGSQLTLTVTDHGMGIPKEDQQHLFERFFRASNAVTIQGTGLGLNIVKRYLELMGGSITFFSTPGEGTTFTITMPTEHT